MYSKFCKEGFKESGYLRVNYNLLKGKGKLAERNRVVCNTSDNLEIN